MDTTACLGCNATLGIGQAEYCPRCWKSAHIVDIPGMLEAANQWPASERGGLTEREGWEEMARWFAAESLQPDDTHTGRSVTDQLKWLEKIRKKNAAPPAHARDTTKKGRRFQGRA